MEKSQPLKNVQDCTDISDCVELSRASGLHLKPIARLSITVTLPQLKSGQSISNWEVMEKLRTAILPEVFSVIKVTKSTLEFLRFDAEIENRKNLMQVIGKIDQKGIKLSGFSDLLKIRATEAKVPFPSRHDWDCFFRDAKHMNEMKPGERPDTVHFQDLPCRWFAHYSDTTTNMPSAYVLSKVMSTFGEVRVVDIPVCDQYRKKMSASINGLHTFSFGQDLIFEAYVQFKEYIGFAKCMHALQGKKLVFSNNDKAWSANIKVDFDRTKHLSEYSIKKRAAEREKLIAAEREKEEKVRRKREMEEMKVEAERMRLEEEQRLKEERKEAKRKEKEERRKSREEKRRKKRLVKEEEKVKKEEEEEEAKFARKIAMEERKLLLAQRKLESIRLLDELFERIKVVKQKQVANQRESELFQHIDKENSKKVKEIKKKELKERKLQEKMASKERMLRDKLVRSYKSREEDRMEQQREKVRKAVQGKVRLQSVISAASLSSISSSTSQSNSDSSSDSDSSDSSTTSSDSNAPKVLVGHMRMDQMQEEKQQSEFGNWPPARPNELQHFPPYYEGQEPYHYHEEWGHDDAYDRGRGRGRGRWRFPRGPWRGRGFRDRGRGFRDRGRGFRGSWQHNMFGPERKTNPSTWYRSGEYNPDISRSRSRSHSRSRSRRTSSRSRSRSRRSRIKSRSRSRSKRYHSKSRSRSKRSHSKSKSRSRSKSKSKRSHSRSKSKSHSRSRSRSHSRSRRSRSKKHRHSSRERSSHSADRRRDKHRNERHRRSSSRKKDNYKKEEDINYNDLRESDLELSSDPEDRYYECEYYEDDEYRENNYQNYYPRGHERGGYSGFRRGFRGRWPRGWRGRGRGNGNPYYGQYDNRDDWRQDVGRRDPYQDIYVKYFESVADRESANKEGNIEERRARQDYRDRKEFDGSREREAVHRVPPPGDRSSSHAQEDVHGDPGPRGRDEYKDPRNVEKIRGDWTGEFDKKGRGSIDRKPQPYSESHKGDKKLLDRVVCAQERRVPEKLEQKHLRVEEVVVRKHDPGLDYSQRYSREKPKFDRWEGEDVRKDLVLREREKQSELGERNRSGQSFDSSSRLPSCVTRDLNEKRYGVTEKPAFERMHERDGSKDFGIDMRWKNQVLRADMERDKREISVKDRLSFGNVKRHSDIELNENRSKQLVPIKSMKMRSIELAETKGKRDNERIETRARLDVDINKTRDRRDVHPKDPRGSREFVRSDRRVREDIRHNETRERSDPERTVVDRDRRVEHSEFRKKREHSEATQSYKSDSESDHSELHRKRQHSDSGRKRRKRRKKKRDKRSDDARKHKHKKKKKRG